MTDAVSFPIADVLGKAEMVFILFVAAVIASFYKKKPSPGLIFFTFACISCFCGLLPSKILMYSLVNKVTLSLVCLYLVIVAALQTGCIQDILGFLFKTCRGNTLRFYLSLTAIASFFPSKRIQKEMISFLRKKDLSSEIPFHFLFPVLFVLASSLTLMGSVTNLVSDHICGEILGGKHWGFFSYGPVAFSLFFVCFLFFFYVVKKQTKTMFEKSLAAPLPFPKENSSEKILMESHALSSSIYPLEGGRLKQAKDLESRSSSTKNITKTTRVGTTVVFCFLVCLTLVGVPLIVTSPISVAVLFFLGAFEKKEQASKLPWDIFLLVVASFIFCHAIIETKLYFFIAQKLQFLHGKFSVLTFFLFSSALLSLFIPCAMVVSFLLPIAITFGKSCEPAFMQLLVAAITLGSFFLFPKKSIISFQKKVNGSQEQLFLLKLQCMWIGIVYFVFIAHSFFITDIA